MKSLYAYFGLLKPHNIDSPGHFLYQLGLIDSLRELFDEEKFDFYSYYPPQVIADSQIFDYPDSELGAIFRKYRGQMIEEGPLPFSEIIEQIKQKVYHKLYLKARFRNLSTLTKKWKDAQEFEQILDAARNAGYTKEQIVILDTDLSLSEKFIMESSEFATIIIPSIDFPGISTRFLDECVATHIGKFDTNRFLNTVFYGNIDTSNYKSGNSKGEILSSILNWCNEFYLTRENSIFLAICKTNEPIVLSGNNAIIPRNERLAIWNALSVSAIMLNVTKDKYAENKFIPARVYEAMIFGMIPVSYRFDFLCPAFSFNDLNDLSEIIKYLNECTPSDLEKAYLHFIKNYKQQLYGPTKNSTI
jgi:hypothetical protein